MSSTLGWFYQLDTHLKALLDIDPVRAIEQARKLDLDGPDRINLMLLRSTTLVDGGALTQQQDAIQEGLSLLRHLHSHFPRSDITYSLANGLVAMAGDPPKDPSWLDHQERSRELRAEARRCFWEVAQDVDAEPALRTQAWTNLANQFSNGFRVSEAHDAWRLALEIDPENGVAAGAAARSLIWLCSQGTCSDLAYVEAQMLAKIAHRRKDRIIQYAGQQAAEHITAFAEKLPDPPERSSHEDPFISWVEHERLSLSPSVELVDPTMGKLDWLTLPAILEREPGGHAVPPPVFAMFNMLKSDFIVARDLAWRSMNDNGWPLTGVYADTLDFATYGPATSAIILAHRTALDLLDKVAATANHYFEIGEAPDKVYFGKLWRGNAKKKAGAGTLHENVEKAIRKGASALYGLVELADDYSDNAGILRSQKDLRNAGTHRFVVLHDFGDPVNIRQAPEIERHERDQFCQEAVRALRVARSAIQMLALSISQNEATLEEREGGLIASLLVPDHDWVRGRGEET